MCLSERREDDGPSSGFTTGSSSTCRRNWDTLTTKATVLMQIHLRYDGICVPHFQLMNQNESIFFYVVNRWAICMLIKI